MRIENGKEIEFDFLKENTPIYDVAHNFIKLKVTCTPIYHIMLNGREFHCSYKGILSNASRITIEDIEQISVAISLFDTNNKSNVLNDLGFGYGVDDFLQCVIDDVLDKVLPIINEQVQMYTEYDTVGEMLSVDPDILEDIEENANDNVRYFVTSLNKNFNSKIEKLFEILDACYFDFIDVAKDFYFECGYLLHACRYDHAIEHQIVTPLKNGKNGKKIYGNFYDTKMGSVFSFNSGKDFKKWCSYKTKGGDD